MQKEIVAKITGRVQGVNFRRQTAKKASELKINGSVENLDDGTVYLVAQGEEKDLHSLINEVLSFPFPVEISNIEIEKKDIVNIYKDFSIKKAESFVKDQIKAMKNLGKTILNVQDEEIKVPHHIAVIPDGNRRWAKSQGLQESMGHKVGSDIDRLLSLFKESKHVGVKYLSFWAFSTENWKRDEKEVSFIFQQLTNALIKAEDLFMKEGTRFRMVGRRDRLPEEIMKGLKRLETLTKDNDTFFLQLLLDYGGRDEIVRAVNKILKEKETREITEEDFFRYLDTEGIPDPDLIIRTSGEKRLSGLLPYQSTYSEIYFSDKFFPEFGLEDFKLALQDYSQRDRRFGASAKKVTK